VRESTFGLGKNNFFLSGFEGFQAVPARLLAKVRLREGTALEVKM
jgi:hypothetical protein